MDTQRKSRKRKRRKLTSSITRNQACCQTCGSHQLVPSLQGPILQGTYTQGPSLQDTYFQRPSLQVPHTQGPSLGVPHLHFPRSSLPVPQAGQLYSNAGTAPGFDPYRGQTFSGHMGSLSGPVGSFLQQTYQTEHRIYTFGTSGVGGVGVSHGVETGQNGQYWTAHGHGQRSSVYRGHRGHLPGVDAGEGVHSNGFIGDMYDGGESSSETPVEDSDEIEASKANRPHARSDFDDENSSHLSDLRGFQQRRRPTRNAITDIGNDGAEKAYRHTRHKDLKQRAKLDEKENFGCEKRPGRRKERSSQNERYLHVQSRNTDGVSERRRGKQRRESSRMARREDRWGVHVGEGVAEDGVHEFHHEEAYHAGVQHHGFHGDEARGQGSYLTSVARQQMSQTCDTRSGEVGRRYKALAFRQEIEEEGIGEEENRRDGAVVQYCHNQPSSGWRKMFGMVHFVYNVLEVNSRENISETDLVPSLLSGFRELKQKSCKWFYDNVNNRFKRNGSAKVIRTLHKHTRKGGKYHSDNESDSGYDPSLFSSFGQSGSSVHGVKSRPSLQGLFPGIAIGNNSMELDNGLYPPPPLSQLSPNGNSYHSPSPNTSLESIPSPQAPPTPTPRTTVTTPTQTQVDLDSTGTPTERDIYREAFEKNKRTEEAKFKIRFDNLMADMQQAFERLSPREGQVPSGYGSTSYGDLMTNYRAKVKDLMVSLSQRLELAVESFDETCANNPSLTSQKVKQMISKLVEDRLGESLDLTSDEAVSDLSSLSDDSGEQKSFEDQIAQAVIARVLELHRNTSGIHLNLSEPLDNQEADSPVSPTAQKGQKRPRNLSYTISAADDNVDRDSSVLKENSGNFGNESSGMEGRSGGERKRNLSYTISDNRDLDYRDDSQGLDNRNRRKSGSKDNEKQRNIKNSGERVNRSKDESYFSDSDTHNNNEDMCDGEAEDFDVFDEDKGAKEKDVSKQSPVNAQNDSSSVQRTRSHSDSPDKSEKGEVDEVKILQEEFEKLRSFAKEVVPKPLYEEVKFVEEIEPEPVEESIECVRVDHDESQEEFSSRFFTYDKVHDTENRSLPDFSDLDYEYHDFGVNEVDPDLLSMNLAPILEETEEELEDDKEDVTEYEQDWRGNWIFKGACGMDSYTELSKNKVNTGFGGSVFMVPKPGDEFTPRIGNTWVEDVSDMSENEDRDSLDGLSDEENSFYAKTSEEIARITRKSSSSQAAQTDGESEAESLTSRPYSSSMSDSGIRSNRLEQNSFDSRTSEKSHVKLSEELVPAEGDDPKFEIPPLSVTVPEGEPAKLTCRVSGTQPLDVFWYRVRDEVEELENSENYEIVKDGNRHHLTMYNMTKEQDAGQYMCMAMNDKGRCCQYFILAMKKNTQELKAPEFLKGVSDIEVKEGQSVKFRCKVKGYPQPRVVWFKDGHLLMNQLNYKLERFGNRDYLLTIDSASMDEDAEYSVLAKNIAGEVRSNAQLIVEPKNKPESVPAASKPITSEKKPEEKKEKRSSSPELPSLSYLPLGRSRNTSSTSSSSSSSLSKKPLSPSARKEEQNLTNLSQKVAMTKESVTEVAEDMLSSSKERDAAKNVRKATSSVLDYLDTTDSLILRDRSMDAMATSTPRSSDNERVFNPDNSDIPLDHHDNEESHKSEVSFSFNPMSISMDGGKSVKQNTEKDRKTSAISENTTKPNQKESTESQKPTDTNLSSDASQTTYSPDNSIEISDTHTSTLESDSEPLVVNLGPKKENKQRFTRDFFINDTPKLSRRTPPTSPRTADDKTTMFISPPSSPRVEEEKKTARTEEKIYLAASNVYQLENKVQSLQDKMRALNMVQEQDKLARIEGQVATTVAQVSSSEKQVQDVEKSVSEIQQPRLTRLNDQQKINSPKTRQAPPPPRPMTPPPEEKPEPTFLKGVTQEQDLPESRTEFNEEYTIELPSVSRLKAMFGQSSAPADRDSSIKRSSQEPLIHSITARSVPKEQLEKLRRTSDDDPSSRVAVRSSEPVNPGRASSLISGQKIKTVPNMPKQVYQSSNFGSGEKASVAVQLPKQSISVASNVKTSDGKSEGKAKQTMNITLSTGNTNRPVSPVQLSPSQPMKTSVTNKTRAPATPSQSGGSAQGSKTGNEIDTPEERKSPKIKSGAISAMSKFWEKRATEPVKEDEVPQILEYE